MSRWIYWPLILVGILLAFHLLLTGSPIPLGIVDSLHSPKSVTAIEDDGVKTADGARANLPNASRIRERPLLVEDIFKHGIEVTPSGDVYGLIRIHHWCGNDPVRYHLARVNLLSLAALLEYDQSMHASKRRIDPGTLHFLRLPPAEIEEIFSEQSSPPNHGPSGTSGTSPAEQALVPEASGAGTAKVAHGLVGFVRNVDALEVAGTQKLRQFDGIAPVGLDFVSGGLLDMGGRDDQAFDAPCLESAGQHESCRSCLVAEAQGMAAALTQLLHQLLDGVQVMADRLQKLRFSTFVGHRYSDGICLARSRSPRPGRDCLRQATPGSPKSPVFYGHRAQYGG